MQRSLLLAVVATGVLGSSALAQSTAAPAGNTASSAGISGGPGLGDTPSTAPAGTSIGSIPVRRADPASGPAPQPGLGSGVNGTTRSTGAGITDNASSKATSSSSYGAGMNSSGSGTRETIAVPPPTATGPVSPTTTSGR